jgi:hypothetical protein
MALYLQRLTRLKVGRASRLSPSSNDRLEASLPCLFLRPLGGEGQDEGALRLPYGFRFFGRCMRGPCSVLPVWPLACPNSPRYELLPKRVSMPRQPPAAKILERRPPGPARRPSERSAEHRLGKFPSSPHPPAPSARHRCSPHQNNISQLHSVRKAKDLFTSSRQNIGAPASWYGAPGTAPASFHLLPIRRAPSARHRCSPRLS